MNTNRRHAIAALTGAGLLWGTTVPLSKLALEWLPPGWLTAVRFGLAAAVLLAAVPKSRLRAAFTPAVLASGAIGYGGTVILQNAGITRTSVTHAALLIGAVPVLVAVIAALWQHTVARPVAWVGFAVSLGGVGLVTAGGGGGGAALGGDGLVLASLLLSATFTVGQARLLPGRDPVAVTAVQFAGAGLLALVFTVITEGAPAAPAGPGPVLAVAALVAGGTLLPFTLFAYGQSRVSAEIAGAFLNLEPLVGAVAGAVVFGNPVGPAQVTGGAAILAGIGLSSLPLIARGSSPEVRAEEGQAGGRQPGSSGLGEGEGRGGRAAGQLLRGASTEDQRGGAGFAERVGQGHLTYVPAARPPRRRPARRPRTARCRRTSSSSWSARTPAGPTGPVRDAPCRGTARRGSWPTTARAVRLRACCWRVEPRLPGYQAARRRTSQTVAAISSTDSASSQPPSIHWNAQNRLTGWWVVHCV